MELRQVKKQEALESKKASSNSKALEIQRSPLCYRKAQQNINSLGETGRAADLLFQCDIH